MGGDGGEGTDRIKWQNVCVGSWRFVILKLFSGIANYWSLTVFYFQKIISYSTYDQCNIYFRTAPGILETRVGHT